VSGGTQAIVERMFVAMDREDLLSDPRFGDNVARVTNVDALDEVIAGWMAKHELQDVLQRLDAAGVAVAAVHDVSQIATHPHFRARELLLRVDDPELGPTSTTHVHPRLSETPGGIGTLGGPIGRDNEAFYLREFGLTEDEYGDLRRAGAI
jgi:crotonobetainyl-CoA:carnitine CoA-transferase CaiB-like acyl-CoA transferase